MQMVPGKDSSLVRELEQKAAQVAFLNVSEFEAELKTLNMEIGSSLKALIGRDGDGDGLCNEVNGVGVPCLPQVQDVPLWSDQHTARFQKRRHAISRFFARKRNKVNFSIGDLFKSQKEGDDELVKNRIGQIFNHDNLGDTGEFRSRVTSVIPVTDPAAGYPYFVVNGEIYDKDDKVVGAFQRTILKKRQQHSS